MDDEVKGLKIPCMVLVKKEALIFFIHLPVSVFSGVFVCDFCLHSWVHKFQSPAFHTMFLCKKDVYA